MPEFALRPAVPSDAQAIADIYNHYVRTSAATFDTEEKSVEDRLAWLAEHDEPYPVLVAERGDDVVAWGSLSRWGTRRAYRHTVEISVYVATDFLGAGLGPMLAQALVDEAGRHGHHAVVSQIVHENEASLRMSERLGFERVGVLREVGRKFDRWLDVVLMELMLPQPAEKVAP
jgi:phosphinothricin acetyltransferase